MFKIRKIVINNLKIVFNCTWERPTIRWLDVAIAAENGASITDVIKQELLRKYSIMVFYGINTTKCSFELT